jgi:hypothetical protein
MTDLRVPRRVYVKEGGVVLFNQLAVKIEMDAVSNEDYFRWLDQTAATIGDAVPGCRIVEKENARVAPPLNVAVYYDTPDYAILPTGALLRTSCNRITHAFCAFKMAEDAHGVRHDHRYVFDGDAKRTIQMAPTSAAAVAIVNRLLARKDIVHPGTYLERHLAIHPEDLEPAICLEDYRFTFFAWIDGKDALRCSVDRFHVSDLRLAEARRERRALSEVELAIYPRISPEVARDARVVQLVRTLQRSLCDRFGVSSTHLIKYQRAAHALGLSHVQAAVAAISSSANRIDPHDPDVGEALRASHLWPRFS